MLARLEPEQIDLLAQIVDAYRRIPRDKRDRFSAVHTHQGSFLFHRGLPDWRPTVARNDLDVLAETGLIRPTTYDGGLVSTFTINQQTLDEYDAFQTQARMPERVEQEIRRYLDASDFRVRYPRSHDKWRMAEELVWSSGRDEVFTTVGHLCRESAQLFATALVEVYRPAEIDANSQHDVARIRAVLATIQDRSPNSLGDAERGLLDALLGYWGAVSDLAQRQEHGAQKGGAPLNQEDSRRLVFHLAIVMFEVDRALRRGLQGSA